MFVGLPLADTAGARTISPSAKVTIRMSVRMLKEPTRSTL
jgi:hypothetical protein